LSAAGKPTSHGFGRALLVVPDADLPASCEAGTQGGERMGRSALLGLAALTAVLTLDAKQTSAQSSYRFYPWCAQYNLPGGPTSCRFSTFEQCRPEVSGVGGQCVVNPYYAAYGPDGRPPSSPRQKSGRTRNRARSRP
jgi:hypothetical protein